MMMFHSLVYKKIFSSELGIEGVKSWITSTPLEAPRLQQNIMGLRTKISQVWHVNFVIVTN
jgi:hypothetical protein